MINFKSFRFRLLSQFLLFLLLSLVFAWVVYYFGRKREGILAMSSNLTRIHVLVTQASKTQHEFYSYEAINSDFFQTHKSDYLNKFRSLSEEIDEQLKEFRKLEYFDEFQLNGRIELISQELKHNRRLFEQLEQLIFRRGFKDYGVEGVMRKHVHRLEEQPEIIAPAQLLSLRRHEKDFILRNDSQYIKKLHQVIVNIIDDIADNEQAEEVSVRNALTDLDIYRDLFNQLVSLELEIGLKTNSGLIRKLNETNEVLDAYFFQARVKANKREKQMLARLYIYFVVTFVIFLLAAFRFSYLLSKKITEPLTALSGSLSHFVSSNFTEKSQIRFTNRHDEVGVLARNVKVLEDEIFDQINFFNQKVQQKTTEVQQQNEQIRQQNYQIEMKNEELQTQNEQIEAQKALVENHNRRLLDSIHYAKRIQTAILPDRSFTKKLLSDHFILYRPKDIVSGDFYWIEQTPGGKQPHTLLGAVDCTGHGVPGAFMSVLGYTTLNDALKEHPEGSPGDLLNYLHHRVYDIFNKNGGSEDKLHDGMDLSLLRFDADFRTLDFAGAYNSLYVVRRSEKGRMKSTAGEKEMNIIVNNDHTLYEIRGDRFPIGHQQSKLRFSCYTLELKKGDRIYITTDGYTDQFGGPNSRRFQKKRFRELLLDLAIVDMPDQLQLFEHNFLAWKGNIEQIDDICVIGMEV